MKDEPLVKERFTAGEVSILTIMPLGGKLRKLLKKPIKPWHFARIFMLNRAINQINRLELWVSVTRHERRTWAK